MKKVRSSRGISPQEESISRVPAARARVAKQVRGQDGLGAISATCFVVVVPMARP